MHATYIKEKDFCGILKIKYTICCISWDIAISRCNEEL